MYTKILCAFLALFATKSNAYWPATFNEWITGAGGWYVSVQHGVPDGNSLLPNPCYSEKACKIYVVLRGTDGYGTDFLYAFNELSYNHSAIRNLRTVGEVEVYLRGQMAFPRNGRTAVNWSSLKNPTNVRVCTLYSTAYSSHVPWPGSEVCDGVPPPNITCNIIPNIIRLDHGEITTDKIEGNTASTTALVACTSPLSVSIKSVSGGHIKLGNSGAITSTLMIGGRTGSSGPIIASPSGYRIEIKSVLKKAGNVTEGEFQGNDVLLLNIN